MKLKPGVDVSLLTPQAVLILLAASRLRPDLTVTSGCDGKHKKGSKHYEGNAVDIRTRGYTADQNVQFVADLKAALGRDFDIVLESDHVHAEYDPK